MREREKPHMHVLTLSSNVSPESFPKDRVTLTLPGRAGFQVHLQTKACFRAGPLKGEGTGKAWL